MRTTLFHIPRDLAGWPLLGIGLALAVWTAICFARLAWKLYRRGPSVAVWNELPVMLVIAAIIAWVLPALSDSQGLPIRGYGVMLFLGVISGVALAAYRAQREGFDPELIYSLAFWMCFCGILGARLFYVIEYWRDFQRAGLSETIAAVINFTRGGLVVYGAVVGGGLAAVVFFIRHKLPVLAMADVIAPSMTLGLALGRIGCFLNGCCYGGQCQLPWAVAFPPESPVYQSQIDRGEYVFEGMHFQPAKPPHKRASEPAIVVSVDENSPAAKAGVQFGDRLATILVTPPEGRPSDYLAVASLDQNFFPGSIAAAQAALMRIEQVGTKIQMDVIDADGHSVVRSWTLDQSTSPPTRSLPVHPAQLYSSLNAFLLTFFLLAWYPFRRHDGEVTALMLTIYPLQRIFEEIIRTDELTVFGTGMTISENVSILMLAAAVALWIFALRGPRLKYAAPKSAL